MRLPVESDEEITSYVDGNVGVIVLNRPHARNALTIGMLETLGELLASMEDDPEIGAVLLTGAGNAFCSGGDVKDFAARGGDTGVVEGPEQWTANRLRLQRITVGRMQQMRTPVIAAVSGAAAGAGLGLALGCTLRVGSPKSLITTAFVKIGLSGDFGVPWSLRRLVGPSRAMRLLLMSERIRGDEAHELGLIDWLVPDDELMESAQRIAATIAAAPRAAVQAIVENVRDADALSLDDSMLAEVQRYRECAATDDHRAAVAAFAATSS